MDASEIRKAQPPPSHCSSCFGQYPDREHVDFCAVWEGPVVEHKSVGVTPVSIDELIICETCIRAAAALLGLVEPAEDAEQVAERETAIGDLRERLTGQADYIRSLEQAAEKRGTLEQAMAPRKRKAAA